MEIDKEFLDREIGDFRALFCTYGYLDINRAIREALESGHNADWAFEQLEQYADNCDMKLSDLDPCYVIMDAILQLARNEIEELTGFDIQNDADFYTSGNWCATTYDWNSDDIDSLTDQLSEYSDSLERLTETTKYWLNQVDIDLQEIMLNNDPDNLID